MGHSWGRGEAYHIWGVTIFPSTWIGLTLIAVFVWTLNTGQLVDMCTGDQSAFLTGHNLRLVLCNNDVWTLGSLQSYCPWHQQSHLSELLAGGCGDFRLKFLLSLCTTGLAFLVWGEERMKVGAFILRPTLPTCISYKANEHLRGKN